MASLYLEAVILIAALTMPIFIFLVVLSEFPYYFGQWRIDRKIRKHNKKVEKLRKDIKRL